jgi:uncharacterized protein GlcG (DUF336 family)
MAASPLESNCKRSVARMTQTGRVWRMPVKTDSSGYFARIASPAQALEGRRESKEDALHLWEGTMPTIKASLLTAILAFAAVQGAEAQVLTQRNVSLAMARTAAEASLRECASKGFPGTSVAVVDRAGQIVLIMRSDASTPQQPEMARRKAYTARMFRRSTVEWAKRTLEDPVTEPQRDLEDVIALAGGVPIMIGDEAIGGIGSAGSTQEQDDACAKAGLAAIANQLR